MATLARTAKQQPPNQVWYRPVERDAAEFMYLAINDTGLYALDAEGQAWQYGSWPTPEGVHVVGWVAMVMDRYEVAT